ncbi:MAG: DUF600 family protein [Treponema sp.]|nr:DUF600 family protein [Treponema sp.]
MNSSLFQSVANKLVPVLPSKWEKVHLYAQISVDAYEFFFYVFVNGKYVQCFDLDNEDEILDVFDELNDIMFPDWNEKKWSVCTYSLDKSGHVSVDYDYDELPDNIMEYKHKWEKKYVV